MRRAVVTVLAVVTGAGVLVPTAEAKLPKTSQVEAFAVKHAPSKILAAYAECRKISPRSWSCDVATARNVGRGGDPDYHTTVRYIGGRLYAGRYVKN